MRIRAVSKLAWLCVALPWFGCGSDSEAETPVAAECNVDPWQCAAGQTCWPSDLQGSYACLPAAAGNAKGADCDNIAAQPHCDEDLSCFPGPVPGKGLCMPFCDATPDHACGPGEFCTTVLLAATQKQLPIHVCQPAAPDGGVSGAGGAAGAPGAGGAAGMDAGSD